LDWVSGGLDGKFKLDLEKSLQTSLEPVCFLAPPSSLVCDAPPGDFTQLRFDARLVFPTFGSQTFTFHGHTVLTGGDVTVPAQRFAYLGGVNTLASVKLLALGGDQLLFLMGEYRIPFERIQVPFLIVHGENDRQIPLEYARQTYAEATNSPRRELKVFTARDGGNEHIGVDNLPLVSTFIADWIGDAFSAEDSR